MTTQTQEINIPIINKTLKRNTFILTIFITSFVLYIETILIIIPPIIALILYIQDNNLKHSFQIFNAIWLLIFTGISIVLLFIYLIVIFFGFFLGNFSTFFVGILYFSFIGIVIFIFAFYFRLLLDFKDLVEKSKEGSDKNIVIEENNADETNEA